MTDLDEEDWEEQTTAFSDVCTDCKNLDKDITTRTCKAFPDGIPSKIWMGENDHRKPYPGDHGIQFVSSTPKQDETAQYVRDKLKKLEDK